MHCTYNSRGEGEVLSCDRDFTAPPCKDSSVVAIDGISYLISFAMVSKFDLSFCYRLGSCIMYVRLPAIGDCKQMAPLSRTECDVGNPSRRTYRCPRQVAILAKKFVTGLANPSILRHDHYQMRMSEMQSGGGDEPSRNRTPSLATQYPYGAPIGSTPRC